MSFKDGWAAINLEMPDRVPRTEYSAEFHWDLVQKVTGISVNSHSSVQVQENASDRFRSAWDYGLVWRILTSSQDLDKCRTKMGHAVYAADGTDYSAEVSCPFETPEDALLFQPMEIYGKQEHSKLVKKFNEDFRAGCEHVPDAVNTTGVYITLVSGLLEIFGWDILLMALGISPEEFGEVANRYTEWVQQYFDALADCEAPVIMIHDDIVWTSGAFAQPAWYRKYVFPNYKKLFAPLREAGKKILFTSDGNYTQFVDDIADCGVNGFVLEPTTDMEYIAEEYGKTHVFVGNADTRVLLFGSREEIYQEVKRCMDIGKKCPGFFMAVGNHIPPNTPVENALYYNEVFEKMRKR